MAEIDLSSLDFFKPFSSEQMGRVASLGEACEAEAGALLTEQGRVGQEAFVIVSGEAEVQVGKDRVATLSPGSIVGEMALLDARPRSATVRAITPMTLIRFDSKEFRKLLSTMPEVEAQKLAEHSIETCEQNFGEDTI